MFCKQRRFGTPRTVHHTESWLKLPFYTSIRIYWVDFENLFHFFFWTAVCGKSTKADLPASPSRPPMLRCTISNTSLIFDSNTTQILNHRQKQLFKFLFLFWFVTSRLALILPPSEITADNSGSRSDLNPIVIQCLKKHNQPIGLVPDRSRVTILPDRNAP